MTAIDDKHAVLGGAGGVLGAPTGAEQATADGAGRFRPFRQGAIYWTSATGAQAVWGMIHSKWRLLGGEAGALGYPISDESPTPDTIGRFNHFQNGSVYWTAVTGAQAVFGPIKKKWAAQGWERGRLGYPVTDEAPTPDGVGRFSHFQGGSIYWTSSTGAQTVLGEIRAKWSALGWEAGLLGYPTTDESPTPDGNGRFNHFQRGSIYWTPAIGAREVHGQIRDRWQALGWEAGRLGYPTTDETPTPDTVGRFTHFQGGSIYWTPTTGAWEVLGEIRDLWAQLGWEQGRLGYPVAGEQDLPNHTAKETRFQRGAIYSDPHRGVYETFPRPDFPPTSAVGGGAWEVVNRRQGVVGMHSAMLHSGKVLFFSFREPPDINNPGPIPPDLGESEVYDFAGNVSQTPAYNGPGGALPSIFCGGHALLPDGRLLVAGGDRESQTRLRSLHLFTPGGAGGGSWQPVGPMAAARWYPTCVTLHDGRVLIAGGERRLPDPNQNRNTTYEIFDPGVNEVGPAVNAAPLNGFGSWITYPFAFVLPNHRLLLHGGTRTVFLNLDNFTFDARTIEAIPRTGRNSRTYGREGAAVLLPLRPEEGYRARVMMLGGGGAEPISMRTSATSSCEILDTSVANPSWQPAAAMPRPRVMPDAVLLPDGMVFVSNGSSRGSADNGANAVWESDLYNPQTNTWQPMAPMNVPRLYHATSILLPDGRVMTAGTDSLFNPHPFHTAERRVEFYSPSYLFRGPRPSIAAAPGAVGYGGAFDIATPEGGAISAVALLRCGSSTHSFNPDQRYVGLAIAGRTGNKITVNGPPNRFLAPPGFYMLFILRDGIPSQARFVQVG